MNRLDDLAENELYTKLALVDTHHKELKTNQLVGTGVRYYTVTTAAAADVSLPFNTGSTSTQGTLDIYFVYTAQHQDFPYAKQNGAIWIDVQDGAHQMLSGTATGSGGHIDLDTYYFSPQVESFTDTYIQRFRVSVKLYGAGTFLAKWSVQATDTGTLSYTGTYAWPGSSGSISG